MQELLTDIEKAGAKDALPLLAFTLERIYDEYHATGHLMLAHYQTLGRIGGSIEARSNAPSRLPTATRAFPGIARPALRCCDAA
ncbi:MAG: hypothetical protein J2P51_14945 [Hyphomicrobiaceae bacterium]|nr:hypothetical protein [Hyphomicrobiaceae bacterium]